MGLIVVSNREPYRPQPNEDGSLGWQASIGGLTAALDPLLARVGGTWIAWGEEYPEVRTVQLPPQHPGYRLLRLTLDPDDVDAFYYGFSNDALWPMTHYFVDRARYRRRDWAAYERVNRQFADAVVATYQPGDIIWVQDYQLALVPRMVREALPDALIGFFWHIPWPSSEVFRTLPWDREILEGILGANLIGMHTREYARHFLSACRIVLGLEAQGSELQLPGHRVRVEAHPIGIETADFEEIAARPEVRERAERIRSELRGPLLLGVDRLDYTKGIPDRLEAFDTFLEAHPEQRGEVTLIQIAVPSREAVESYRRLREEVEGLVGRINGAHGREAWTPIHYQYRGLPREELIAHYLAADVMLVTPLRDGLNLVAKEFAAVSQRGVLILSEFAGAAAEMPEAIITNPFDHDGLAADIERALRMPEQERLRRLEALKRGLREHDLAGWARGFLRQLAPHAELA